jgi:hypothetical protein
MRSARLLNLLAMRGRLTLLSLFVIFFIPSFGCMPLMDLPLTREVTSTPKGSPPDEGPLMQTELLERVSAPSPVRRKEIAFIHKQTASAPARQVSQVSKGRERVATAHTDGTSVATILRELPDAHALLVPVSPRMETLNASEKDGTSIDLSEVMIFLVVGAVFLLVHISRRRPASSSPDTALAKLLHTRPWR